MQVTEHKKLGLFQYSNDWKRGSITSIFILNNLTTEGNAKKGLDSCMEKDPIHQWKELSADKVLIP